ncbi:calcium/sodium antiporter [Halobacteriovorax sp. XZX-3]|uniref:calcium/sodium antiporter n=1 Tax=unclassified Halobacteriovorax TaxID=2639665 RepID=UPI000CD1EFCC|nr:calcium/sodium antiporter [Halobacteriovorax sp. DA5]POB12507.1 hypothetical protein C0Z22_15235 [Halobacteriovorax sp. DA5]
MVLQVVLLILAIVMLYYGAEFALESAEKIGLALGLSPLVIGLLIVGFGTSLPEFFVSQLASYRGEPGIALGNIVGSNIANLFLILGVSGLMGRLFISGTEIKKQLLLHLALTVILGIVLLQDQIYWWGSALLIGFMLFYLWDTFASMKKERAHLGNQEQPHHMDEKIGPKEIIHLFAGFALLYGGGELLVKSGTAVALEFGISNYVISAIFVAFGTSFPELVTAIMTSRKGKNSDIITGNIIGSNIFNAAFVLGSLVFYKIKIAENFIPEMSALLFASLFLLAICFAKRAFYRIAGGVFLACYIAMVLYWVR